MHLHCGYFADALSLFDYCESQIVSARNILDKAVAGNPDARSQLLDKYYQDTDFLRGWQGVAARDGAITIFNFAKALISIKTARQKCQSIRDHVCGPNLEDLLRIFGNHFRDYDLVRQATAHAGELTRSPELMEKSFAEGPFDNHGIRMEAGTSASVSGIFGRDVVVTKEGQILSYRIDHESLEVLVRVLRGCYALLSKLARISKEKLLAQISQAKPP